MLGVFTSLLQYYHERHTHKTGRRLTEVIQDDMMKLQGNELRPAVYRHDSGVPQC